MEISTEDRRLLDLPIHRLRIGYGLQEANQNEVDYIYVGSEETADRTINLVNVDGAWLLQTVAKEYITAGELEKMLQGSIADGVAPPSFAVVSFLLLQLLRELKSKRVADVDVFLKLKKPELKRLLQDSPYASGSAIHEKQ